MPSLYVDPDDLATTLALSDDVKAAKADDLERACFSASNAVDEHCDTVFQMSDDTNDEARRFTALGPSLCLIDDLASFTQLRLDRWGTGSFDQTLTEETDFVLLRASAGESKGWPFNRIRIRERSVKTFPGCELGVEVTGRWGWLETPTDVVEAVGLLATQLYNRRTQSAMGVISINQQVAIRVLRYDTHLCNLLEPYVRTGAMVG